MTAAIHLTIDNPKALIGKSSVTIDVFIDDEQVDTVSIGENKVIPCPPGGHSIYLKLGFGMINKKSKAITVNVPEGQSAPVQASYSRMWGNFKLST